MTFIFYLIHIRTNYKIMFLKKVYLCVKQIKMSELDSFIILLIQLSNSDLYTQLILFI